MRHYLFEEKDPVLLGEDGKVVRWARWAGGALMVAGGMEMVLGMVLVVRHA